MAEVYAIVECRVEYNDGRSEIRRPTFSEIATGIASVDTTSVIKFLKDGLLNVRDVQVIDILHFNSFEDYKKYLR